MITLLTSEELSVAIFIHSYDVSLVLTTNRKHTKIHLHQHIKGPQVTQGRFQRTLLINYNVRFLWYSRTMFGFLKATFILEKLKFERKM